MKNKWETDQLCVCCEIQTGELRELHHLFTRGARLDLQFFPWNQIPVCRQHHGKFGSRGTSYMAEKFPKVKSWLLDNNWYFEEFRKRWWHDGANIGT